MTVLRGWGRTAVPNPGLRPALHPRIVAAATAGSCVVHLWLVAGSHHGLWLNLLMLAMVGVCLPCAVHIWRDGRPGALRQVMACGLAMTVLHAALLMGGAGSGHGAGPAGGAGWASGHSHGAAALPAAAAAGSAAGSGAEILLAVIAVEITTALLAATLLARLRRL
ncbi:hypothetical protein [Arthrobacter oryzae]|uniref:hypothetical protein n=1 Tax=Arthrobacter oryzae TaxID=409290 RepID=UPI00285AEF86|nr:hypothetical protein [Arthrobacter oryzae]MDR6507948.1 hypothetical protein [Arthrobacter oryzae]